MGLYDTVNFRCPNCNNRIEVQTKAGACDLREFFSGSVPMDIAASLRDDDLGCEPCGKIWRVRVDAPPTVRLYLEEE
jgi:hypothetical protein